MSSDDIPDDYAYLSSSGKLELFVAGTLDEKEMGRISTIALTNPMVAQEIAIIERVMLDFLAPAEFSLTKEEKEREIDEIFNKITAPPQKTSGAANIINSFKFFDKKTCLKPKSDIEFIHKLSGREFEQLIANMLRKPGASIELTKETHDGGKDIIIRFKSDLGESVFYAECKRVKRSQSVGVDVVRRLYGVVTNDRVNGGLVITNGHFSKEAWAFKNETKHQIWLIDIDKLSEIVRWL